MSSYNYNTQSDVLYTLSAYNEHSFYPRLTLLDACILSLVKSFNDNNTKFFMSNIELGKLFLSDPGTVQRSIDRLTKVGLVTKEKERKGKQQIRYLTYQPQVLEEISASCLLEK